MKAREAVLTLGPADAAALAAEREARRAAGLVAIVVGIPAVLAAGATLALVAVATAVLLAPAVAAVLIWTAWRYGRPAPRHRAAGAR